MMHQLHGISILNGPASQCNPVSSVSSERKLCDLSFFLFNMELLQLFFKIYSLLDLPFIQKELFNFFHIHMLPQ